MSQFAYSWVVANNLLTPEYIKDNDQLIRLTEEVLDARSIRYASGVSNISVEELKNILEKLRYRKTITATESSSSCSDAARLVEDDM